ncbi:MAG: PHP domain-containing protein [Candidatus Lokiarchaeota archaeon]|nr:PHP domain-containing protein [Candidatus Lokiarchaeota archaeon]
MILPKINLHIHSNFSDGKNTVEQIVDRANELKFNFIAITDHFSDSWKANIIKTLNSYDIINDYLNEIEILNRDLKKAKSNLKILKGIEIDLESSFNYIMKLIHPKEFDIILFEYLDNPESLAFVQKIISEWRKKKKLGKKNPLFGLAHFDPANFIYFDMSILLNIMSKYHIYYEFNSNYPQFYSTKYKELFFDKLILFKIPIAVSSDAHYLNQLDEIDEPISMIEYYDLVDNFKILLEKLDKFQ